VREAILDGEATGVWGKESAVAYHVFDVLWLEGKDVTSLPLEARRAVLRSVGNFIVLVEGGEGKERFRGRG
jgi:ATP-dependent DNA ligase